MPVRKPCATATEETGIQDKPFSQASENNKQPILEVLREHLREPGTLLEIGAGTGQHAAWLPAFLPHVRWQPSDLPDALPGIKAWLTEAPANVRPPMVLDVRGRWPEGPFDYIFTANTFHIMDADSVARCIREAAARLTTDGLWLVYGPFRYDGRCSESNARFDEWLRQRDPGSGLRDYEWVAEQMAAAGLAPVADHEMPANNRTLVFGK